MRHPHLNMLIELTEFKLIGQVKTYLPSIEQIPLTFTVRGSSVKADKVQKTAPSVLLFDWTLSFFT